MTIRRGVFQVPQKPHTEKRMLRHAFTAFLLSILFAACPVVMPGSRAGEGQTPAKKAPIPRTPGEMRELMGDGYAYVEKDELLIVSDLDDKTLHPLVSLDFLVYMHVLKRDFFDKRIAVNTKNPQPILTVFLFKNRESYVQGLRKIGIAVAAEDEMNQGAVRNGYYYGGRERNYIVANYRDDYELGIATYAHELTHALVKKEFPNVPAWMNEGMATMFGHSRVVNSQLRYIENPSLDRVESALQKGELLPLDELFRLSGKEYSQRRGSTRYYDASEQFCRFLHSRNQLRLLYHNLRENTGKRETNEEIVRRITGLDLDSLQEAWHDWLLPRD